MAETATASRLITAAEFQALPDDGRRLELVRGEVVEMAGTGMEHTVVAMTLGSELSVHVRQHGLGVVGGADAGCWLERDPDTVLIPDAVFWSTARLSAGPLPTSFAEAVPDLVVEVVSPNDKRTDVYRKVAMWLAAGVQVVWVVWPASATVHVYRSDADLRVLGASDTLSGDELLPGFALPLAAVFAGLPAVEG